MRIRAVLAFGSCNDTAGCKWHENGLCGDMKPTMQLTQTPPIICTSKGISEFFLNLMCLPRTSKEGMKCKLWTCFRRAFHCNTNKQKDIWNSNELMKRAQMFGAFPLPSFYYQLFSVLLSVLFCPSGSDFPLDPYASLTAHT